MSTPTIPPRRARNSSRCSPRPRSSPRSSSRRTSACASRSLAWRPRRAPAAGDERRARARRPRARAGGAPGRDGGALPEGRGGEQGVRRPLHRDRGAEQQPGQPLRGLLPAPLHARLQGGRPHRPGDRHQPDRRRGLPHLHGQREDRAARAARAPRARRRRPALAIGEGLIGKAAAHGRELLRGEGGAPRAHAVRPAHRRHPAEDQGQRDRRRSRSTSCWSRRRPSPPWTTSCSRCSPGHAATAIFSAKLYSTSARKLTTLQGFLDMLKQPAKTP